MRLKSNQIRGKRVALRTLTADDAPHIATLAGDWDVARMTDRIPYPYRERDALTWIDGLPDNERVFAIDLDGRLVGMCGVMLHPEGDAEIGYWIGRPWWGQGFATEAAALLIKYCFRDLKLSGITSGHYIDNPASQRVIEKLGFQKIGARYSWCQARRREVAAIIYELKRPRFAFLWRPAA